MHALEVPAETDLHDGLLRKLDIVDFRGVEKYDAIMYIDVDIIVTKEIQGLIERCSLYPNYLHAASEKEDWNHPFFGFQNYTREDEQHFSKLGASTFNNGTLIFVPTSEMLANFTALRKFARERPDLRAKYYDQSFFNDFFNRRGLASVSILGPRVIIFPKPGRTYKNKSIIHFAGLGNYATKTARMAEYLHLLNLNPESQSGISLRNLTSN